MRGIQFRGKSVDTGKWTHGYLIGDNVIVGNIVEFNDEYFNTSFWQKVRPETVVQYTGLKDKNGIEVFEGDILKDSKGEGEVKWVQEHCAFLVRTLNSHMYHYLQYDERLTDSEVIGNIYEKAVKE